MPTLNQPVLTYALLFDHSTDGVGSQTVHSQTPFLHLRFNTPAAKDNLLVLGFVADDQSMTTGDITNVFTGAYRLSARVPLSRLPLYVDLLRNEKPVSIWANFTAEPTVGQTLPLLALTLFTGPEPVGEGEGLGG